MSFDERAIYFDANEAKIKNESYAALNRVAKFLTDNPNLKMEIIGHTDLHGTHEYNMDLSRKRAEAVREYLIEQGVDGERLQTSGAGFTRPIVNKKGDGFDEQNRRTEFGVLGLE